MGLYNKDTKIDNTTTQRWVSQIDKDTREDVNNPFWDMFWNLGGASADKVLHPRNQQGHLQEEEGRVPLTDSLNSVWQTVSQDLSGLLNPGNLLNFQRKNGAVPTLSQYEHCKNVDGLSVWNRFGQWQCLFPASIKPDDIPLNAMGQGKDPYLTKEIVMGDKDHKLGLYFTEFGDFLDWRLQMSKLVQEKRLQEQKKSSPISSSSLTPEGLMLDSYNDHGMNDDKGKKVVGRAEFIQSFDSTDEGKGTIKKFKTYYDDGSVLIKSTKIKQPINNERPQVETSEDLIPASKDDDERIW
ncbi:Mpm1p NDAI_0G05720 [Naumovozyma dairenensis CBS 421]|uniref:Mitochondrial peculiar membrane protein 1 n=1 Tax=Naumovozyma dairenensis (strain ATCC 10597 / BCRC 20456 / CBS 421 / NBRC 0211 / NRRL Y-12639) TaxID=1071378 RepID=J7SBT7_NAUDC|nr:hypothetical protein NDAI_0G05720 [Naumovozyma dairenensis CBS 421]CCK73555.1 hypothetical protein NDAI_0G05720 [Naumovozyma dairenensis CBS 421]